MKLLVAEDDAILRRFLTLILEEDGYVVDATSSAEEARVSALTNQYDGIVLDLHLADGHGRDVIKAIRANRSAVPILVFTGRAEREEVIAALDAGADDYITKPTDGSLIRARVRALVRRGQRGEMPSDRVLTLGNVRLSMARRRVEVGAAMVQLTPKELLVLQHLMLKAGTVVSRTDLLEKVWDMQFDPESNIVDTHVSRLRSKLKTAGASVVPRGVRGGGFMMEEELRGPDGT